jgi:hypothetical protein
MTLIEAAKLALEALTHKKWFRIGLGEPNDPRVEAAIAALNAVIEQAEKQEPTVCLPRPVWEAVLMVNEFAETHVCTTPPAAQRKLLTQAQIESGRRASWGFNSDYFTAGVRFAEAAHGIKEKNT